MGRRRAVVGFLSMICAAGCGSSGPQDHANDYPVQKRALEQAVNGPYYPGGLSPASSGRCAAQVLGADAHAIYAWVFCVPRDKGVGVGGLSGPVLASVGGSGTITRVATTGDGSAYESSIKAMFPAGIARRMLRRDIDFQALEKQVA